jgi:hypothetical protein
MNVRLKKTFGWYSGLVHQEAFSVNHCSAEINMLTISPSNEEQNIAYERLKFFVQTVLDDSIMISENSPLLDHYQKIGARLVIFPDEPVDQVVSMMLYLKFNAIMENRIVVTDIELWSKAGDSVSYLHSVGETLGPLTHAGWWADPRPIWASPQEKSSQEKIVNLDRIPEWKDYGLEWDQESESGNSVVFAKFGQDEDK